MYSDRSFGSSGFHSNDPEDSDSIKTEDMVAFADAIEDYMDLLEEVMVIPDEIKRECTDDIEEAKKRVRKLIKKLRKGDRSVFNDGDWNLVI